MTIDDSSSGSSKNVQVLVRVRPFNEREQQFGSHTCVTVHPQTASLDLAAKPEHKSFTYDVVCGSDTDQNTIFSSVGKPITDSVLEGYNGTIFGE